MPRRTSKKRARPARVSEPIQVYLDSRDRALLDKLAQQAELPRSEILRMGLRRLGAESAESGRPGGSFDLLIGALTDDRVPTDLAAKHDEYLYPIRQPKPRKRR